MLWASNCSITESLLELIQQVRQGLAGAPSPMVQYSGSVVLEINKLTAKKYPTLKIFHFPQFLQFCQSTILHSFSPMIQYLEFVYLEIKRSTAKNSNFGNFSVFSISPNLSIYDSTQFFYYGTFGNQQIKSVTLKIYE